MKVFFKEKDTPKVISKIEKALAGRKLGDLVSLSANGKQLVVTISKLGTSTLTFSPTDKDDGIEFSLSNEKIAFAHKAFKDEFKEKLFGVIESAGGKIVARS